MRTKLIAILAVPLAAILVNAGIETRSVLTSTRDVTRVSDLATLSRSATALVSALQLERNYSVGFVADSVDGSRPSTRVVETMRQVTDARLADFRKQVDDRGDSFAPDAQRAVLAAEQRLERLDGIRRAVLTTRSPDSPRMIYTSVVVGLVDLIDRIPQGQDDFQLASIVTATSGLVWANEALSAQQALVYGIVLANRPYNNIDSREFLDLDTSREQALATFRQSATREQVAAYEKLVRGNDVDLTEAYSETILNRQPGEAITLDATRWLQSTQKTVGLNDTAVASLFDAMDSRIDDLRSTIQREALLGGLVVLVILAAALLAAVIVARSLVQPLLGLRTAALDVAGRKLPEAVDRLRRSGEQEITAEIEPIGIDTNEEIGEVAKAFDRVHLEAVRLASEQASLRNNVNAMFVNLSRRSQGLVERQLRLIDDLENREQDPDQLANLFKLDHLATRMRRNNESLLVLAGTDTARRWTHPVPLNEVVLAAISEVEQYTRVKQVTAASVSIAGSGVSDVVHLIAELLENATSFSPPATDVLVSSHSLGPGAGAMIEIEDRGIGMPAKDLERVNERLVDPPLVDVSVSRTMGLFAVGRLAKRHGIRVQLRESAAGGITAVVRLPAKVVTGDSGSGAFPGRTAPTAPITGRGLESPTERISRGPGGRAPELNGAGTPGAGIPMLDSGPRQLPSRGLPLPPSTGGGTPPGQNAEGETRRRPGEPADRRDAADAASDPHANPETTTDMGLETFVRPGPPTRPPLPPTGPLPVIGPDPDEDLDSAIGVDAATGPFDPATGSFEVTGATERPGQPDDVEQAPDTPERDTEETETIFRVPTGATPPPQAPPTGPASGPTAQLDATGPITRPAFGTLRPGRVGPPALPDGAAARGSDAPVRSPFEPAREHPDPPATEGSRPPAARDDVPTRSLRDPSGPADRAAVGPLEDPGFVRAADLPDRAADRDFDETDTTPIFDSVSAWFQRRSPSTPERRPVGAAHTYPQPRPQNRPSAPTGPGAGGAGPRPPLPSRDPRQARAPYPPPFGGPGSRPGSPGMPSLDRPDTRPAPAGAPPAPATRPAPAAPTPPTPVAAPASSAAPPAPPAPPTSPTPPTPPAPAERRAPAAAGSRPAVQVTGPTAPTARGGPDDTGWTSAGDAGWRAAEAARLGAAQAARAGNNNNNDGGFTRSGLPVRVPMTHLVPGSAEPAQPRQQTDTSTRSPEVVGSRLANFYQGVRQGRDVGSDTTNRPRRDTQEER